jgi:enoyl-CoA hydratase/carnithine racemase
VAGRLVGRELLPVPTQAIGGRPHGIGSRRRTRLFSSARFCTQFIKLGLGGCDIGVSYTLPRIVGAGPAFDLILAARVVDADEALRLGIVSRLSGSAVEDARSTLPKGSADTANSDSSRPSGCCGRTSSLEAALHVENRGQILASTSGEMPEAVNAAFHRRQR